MRLALVYQTGIANVFRCDGHPERRTRLMQADYGSCEWFARGAIAAGAQLEVFHADVAGDCRLAEWVDGKGDLWADQKRPPVAA